MRDLIKRFPEQFSWKPEVQNSTFLKKFHKFVVVGMGGSNLSAGLLKAWKPSYDIIEHRSYGLPELQQDELKERLIVLSSYSGNTEEVIEAFHESLKRNFNMVIIAIGGKLLELAKEAGVPYIKLPDSKLEPRLALGLNFVALLKAMGEEEALGEARKLSQFLKPEDLEEKGKEISLKIKSCVPVIYSSWVNKGVAYNWKIKFNETSKIPAFFNVFPELNHNEMTGFDASDSTKNLSERFHFIILKDEDDSPRILRRMEVLGKLWDERKLPYEMITLTGKGLYKIFSSLILADWTTYYTAQNYGTDPFNVPMVEEFKKLIGQ